MFVTTPPIYSTEETLIVALQEQEVSSESWRRCAWACNPDRPLTRRNQEFTDAEEAELQRLIQTSGGAVGVWTRPIKRLSSRG
jgi:hypothetical protein